MINMDLALYAIPPGESYMRSYHLRRFHRNTLQIQLLSSNTEVNAFRDRLDHVAATEGRNAYYYELKDQLDVLHARQVGLHAVLNLHRRVPDCVCMLPS